MPGNDVRRSHSSVRTTIKQCSGNPRQLLSKCQHQPRQQSLKATKLKDFVLCLSRPHFPQALSGTWQQVTWQPLLYKMANGIISEYKRIFFFFFLSQLYLPHHSPHPTAPVPTKSLRKQYIGAGKPTPECPLVATLGTAPIYLEIRCSVTVR